MHKAILVAQIESFLSKRHKENKNIHVDCTLGFGGHLGAILKYFNKNDVVLALDRDAEALEQAQCSLGLSSIRYFNHPFSTLNQVLERENITYFTSLMADLGISSYHIDQAKRGFSFLRDDELDMRMNQQDVKRASDVLKSYSESELTRVFNDHADLPTVHKLVATILLKRQERPIATAFQLLEIIKKSFYFRNSRKRYLSTCAQVFQALRMEVNQELTELNMLLNHIDSYLAVGGRVCFLTFHSIEDRYVKRFFSARKKQFELQGKVIKPNQAEIKENSRSKSAKLRCYERLA